MRTVVAALHQGRGLATALCILGLAGACATNPVSGRQELALISVADEIAMGRQGAAEVAASIGLHPDAELQAYVSRIGLALAARSQRPQLAWEFKVLDDASVNAFALPGGFIFVTRGLLTHMTSEAELAGVLGHEIGHVAARHSVQQMSREQLASLGLGLGSILSPVVAQYGSLASAGLGLLFLKNSRDDETQSDALGFRYALDGGYDTREMLGLFAMLQRNAALGGASRLPEWQASHPDPANRLDDVRKLIARETAGFADKRVGADAFLARVDGLVYGEDPREGYSVGARFVHPGLVFVMDFPTGWRVMNARDAVTAVSAEGDAVLELRSAKGSADQAARAFVGQEGITANAVVAGAIHGNRASSADFTAATGDGAQVRGRATFIEYNGATWALTAFTAASRFATYETAISRSVGSFERLTDPAALAVQPLRVRLVRVPQAMTMARFHALHPSAVSLAEVALINGMSESATITAGQQLKQVVGVLPARVSNTP